MSRGRPSTLLASARMRKAGLRLSYTPMSAGKGDGGAPRAETNAMSTTMPAARRGSRFTADSAFSAAWTVKGGPGRKKAAEPMGVDRDAAGRLAGLVWHEPGPDAKKRFDGLARVGVDGTGCRRGHGHITIVVNHDASAVAWAHRGRGKEVPDLFFGELPPEQREPIPVATGDGARRIADPMRERCPNADRRVDPFHVVEWADDALGSARLDSWRRARIALPGLQRKAREAKKSRADGQDGLRAGIKDAKKAVEGLKNSECALGKNEQDLTERQRERLSTIQSEDGPLARGRRPKERLGAAFAPRDPGLAEECLDRWTRGARRCGTAASVELRRKIRRHREHILDTVRFGLGNARIGATNNKIRLPLRIACGFRDIDTMTGLAMPVCSSMEIPCPGRKRNTPTDTGA